MVGQADKDMASEGRLEDLQSTRKANIKLLELLVCPLTHRPLEYDPEKQELVSDKARLAFPIRDGIPIMLVEEARSLDD